MSINNTLSRMLSEPDAQQRSILEGDFIDEDIEGEGQISFLNGLAGDLDARVVCINKNTDQKLLVVTQDKALLTLKRNLAMLGRREWIAPLSTVMTILTALITSNFRQALGLGPSEWRAIFIVSGFIAMGWLVFTVRKALHAKSFNEVIRDVVYELGNRRKPQLEALS